MEFAASIANYAADELVTTRKELRYMTDQYEKIYNEKAALEEKMLEMEKKVLEMERKTLEMEAKLTMWSIKHILTEYEAEWSKAITDIDKIRMIEEKYDIACKMESIVKKSGQ